MERAWRAPPGQPIGRVGPAVPVGGGFALVRASHRRLVAGSPAAGFELGCC